MSSIESIASDQCARILTPNVERLSDEELTRLNDLLPWKCFTLDSNGRRLGKPASERKRNVPQVVPDHRIAELNRRIPLAGLEVLEVGCFEGVHTAALAGYGATVTAVDSRIENVVKTIVRCWCFGHSIQAFKCDVESPADFALLPEVDVVHHIGVLYHLADPVSHLAAITAKARRAIMLDTHVARENEAAKSYEVNGMAYRYQEYREGGRDNVFAGMYEHAKWLLLETIEMLLRAHGFPLLHVAEMRDERNGLRALIYASRD